MFALSNASTATSIKIKPCLYFVVHFNYFSLLGLSLLINSYMSYVIPLVVFILLTLQLVFPSNQSRISHCLILMLPVNLFFDRIYLSYDLIKSIIYRHVFPWHAEASIVTSHSSF
jgi:hypothetical protein